MLLAACSLAACQPDATPADAKKTQVESAASRNEAAPRDAPTTVGLETHVAPPRPIAREEMSALADAVAEQGDAHSLAVAALLRDFGDDKSMLLPGASPNVVPKPNDKIRKWLDDAERQSPDEVVVLVVAIYLERFDTVRRKALIDRWRALEPDNLTPILFAQYPEAQLFDAASSANRYDSHYADFLRAVVGSLLRPSLQAHVRLIAARSGNTPEEYVVGLATSYWSLVLMPAFQQILTPCRQQQLADARHLQCRWIAEIMFRRGDTILTDMIGASMIQRLAETASERQEAQARRREDNWLMLCMGEAYEREPRAHLKRFARLLTGTELFTERSLMRQLVVEAGYPPLPPPGWDHDSNRRSGQ